MHRGLWIAGLGLAWLVGCGGGSGKDGWSAARPPAKRCVPNIRSTVTPTAGVSFDPGHMPCVEVQMEPDDYASLTAETTFGPGLGIKGAFEAFDAIAERCGDPWPKEYSWYRADLTPSAGEPEPLGDWLKGDLPRQLSRIPAISTRMQHELRRLISNVWDEAALLARIDRYSALVKTAQDSDSYDDQVQALRDWVQARPETITGMLAGGLPAGATEPSSCMKDEGGGK